MCFIGEVIYAIIAPLYRPNQGGRSRANGSELRMRVGFNFFKVFLDYEQILFFSFICLL